MMGRTHLHELLREEQEPFQLKSFIADRRSQLRSTATHPLHLPKPKPATTSFSSTLCIGHVCLFSFHDSPDFRNSPFIDFSTASNKTNETGAVFLQVPARTAAMLFEAAARVQKPGPGLFKNTRFGLFGSLIRRLKDRSSKPKSREVGPVSSSPPTRRRRKKTVTGGDEKRLSNNSSVGWSEKSSELETSCSSRSIHDSEEVEFVNLDGEDDCFRRSSCEKCFASNPSSPFRFSLQLSPSPTRRKPDSTSTVASPSRHFQEDKESYKGERPQEIQEEDDKEKEQCSPVSVLDPIFDDDEEHDSGVIEEDGYDIESSYASVQRAKLQLLQKLQQFERLAGLDPNELEKHMLERYSDDEDASSVITDEEESTEKEFVGGILNHLGVGKIPWYMKKLVLDLIVEETKNEEHQVVVERVCKRLHSWKIVELNTIDMMVETDFKSQGWKRYDEETIRETGKDIASSIFEFLMEELTHELVNSCVQGDFKELLFCLL